MQLHTACLPACDATARCLPAWDAGPQVRRAQQLLAAYRAVAALRADEEFQEDASDPAVQAALRDMGLHNNTDT